jgi:two-component system LytT family response regulator
MIIKAVIVDDEERARLALRNLLTAYCPDIRIVAESNGVRQAVDSIKQHSPHLVFLDIEMPELNGFRLFELIEDIHFRVVFVTAYSDYAVRAFEVGAVDYLLKPIEIEALIRSVNRVKDRIQPIETNREQIDVVQKMMSGELHKIAVPTGAGLTMILTDHLVVLAADGSYTTLHLINGDRHVISKKLNFFEQIISGHPNFIRIHRSHIVHLKYVRQYNKGNHTLLMDNNMVLSVSRDKKSELDKRLKCVLRNDCDS